MQFGNPSEWILYTYPYTRQFSASYLVWFHLYHCNILFILKNINPYIYITGITDTSDQTFFNLEKKLRSSQSRRSFSLSFPHTVLESLLSIFSVILKTALDFYYNILIIPDRFQTLSLIFPVYSSYCFLTEYSPYCFHTHWLNILHTVYIFFHWVFPILFIFFHWILVFPILEIFLI